MNKFFEPLMRKVASDDLDPKKVGAMTAGAGVVGGLSGLAPLIAYSDKVAIPSNIRFGNAIGRLEDVGNNRTAQLVQLLNGKIIPGARGERELKDSIIRNHVRVKKLKEAYNKSLRRHSLAMRGITAAGLLGGGALGAYGAGKLYDKLAD